MDILLLFLQGILAGVVMGAPKSPPGIMCIKRILLQRNKNSFFTGFGVATADLVYALLAGIGAAFTLSFIYDYKHIIKITLGVLFILVGLGDIILIRKKEYCKSKIKSSKNFLYGFGITMINPINIFGFILMYAIIGLNPLTSTPIEALSVILGCFIGSLTLWSGISLWAFKKDLFISKFAHHIPRVSGILIFLSGIAFLLKH